MVGCVPETWPILSEMESSRSSTTSVGSHCPPGTTVTVIPSHHSPTTTEGTPAGCEQRGQGHTRLVALPTFLRGALGENQKRNLRRQGYKAPRVETLEELNALLSDLGAS